MKHRLLSLSGLILFVLVLFATDVLAQESGKITGVIIDQSTEETLAGATVQIVGTNRGVVTDQNGRYSITNVEPGIIELQASYIGYTKMIKEVDVLSDESIEVNFSLSWDSVQGDEVIVSAQARGQTSAINEQRKSNTITNIVSSERIRELPDVNAAESIGRLPGISIQRSGGEANKVAVRGLSPKYNTVTVNGVRVPSTGGDDRSVDLSLISSNMLDGVEVQKAITPDKDADALGGAIDMRLREAADEFMIDATLQGGYNDLRSDMGNYKVGIDASNRFLDGKLGVIAGANFDKNNRSSDRFNGNYRVDENTEGEETSIYQTIGFQFENLNRERVGASLVADYRLPYGKLTGNAFYNRLSDDRISRNNGLLLTDARATFNIADRSGDTDILTGALAIEQDFGPVRFDAGVAQTSSSTNNPEDYVYTFWQLGIGGVAAEESSEPEDLLQASELFPDDVGLNEVYRWQTDREENETSTYLNVEVPFQFTSLIHGFVKTGGKLRWMDRFNDEEQVGRNALIYGSDQGTVNNTFSCIDEARPGMNIEETVLEHQLMPLSYFDGGFSRSNFLNGNVESAFREGFGADVNQLHNFRSIMFEQCDPERNSIGSLARDYDGVERYQAAYAMAQMNIGNNITFIPGFRWERDFSRYNGFRFKEITGGSSGNQQLPPANLEELTAERDNEFFLPMVHLIYRPTDWIDVRAAYTETLTRPDFIHYAPITRINSFNSYFFASNTDLVPSNAVNYDLSVSLYDNKIGFFTVSGFYKEITNLIFQTQFNIRPGIDPLPGMNLREEWIDSNPNGDTFVNNEDPAFVRGIELDWQTHFWYLPAPLNGLVLNVNYTKIGSEMDVPRFRVESETISLRPPVIENTLVEESRSARLPDQPSDILNLSLGYDFKGFSGRVSFLYQTSTTTFIGPRSSLDNFTGDLKRWDVSLKQRINQNFELFANLNNISNRPDRNFRGGALSNPTMTAYYGFTSDVGVRFRL